MQYLSLFSCMQSPGKETRLGGHAATTFHDQVGHQVLHLFSKFYTDCSQLAASSLADCWFSHHYITQTHSKFTSTCTTPANKTNNILFAVFIFSQISTLITSCIIFCAKTKKGTGISSRGREAYLLYKGSSCNSGISFSTKLAAAPSPCTLHHTYEVQYHLYV